MGLWREYLSSQEKRKSYESKMLLMYALVKVVIVNTTSLITKKKPMKVRELLLLDVYMVRIKE